MHLMMSYLSNMTQQTKKNHVYTLHGVYQYVVEVEVVYVRKLFGKNVNYRVNKIEELYLLY